MCVSEYLLKTASLPAIQKASNISSACLSSPYDFIDDCCEDFNQLLCGLFFFLLPKNIMLLPSSSHLNHDEPLTSDLIALLNERL